VENGLESFINLVKIKRKLLYLKAQSVPRCKHFQVGYKKTVSMVEVAQVAVCSQIDTKHINTVWAERIVV
jgi:hypothetical protein